MHNGKGVTRMLMPFCRLGKTGFRVTILGPTASNFDMGIDNPCDVERDEQTVTVSGIRSTEIGGIIRLMLLKYPTEIKITGITG